MTSHSLERLFAPKSVAVIGASDRIGRPGNQVLRTLKRFDASLPVYPVTPKYREILDSACLATVSDLPPVDLAIIAGSVDRIESDVHGVIEQGARAVMIFGALPAGDQRTSWTARIAGICREADVPLLGPDTLGYINVGCSVGATWALPETMRSGGISILSQSGTVFWEAITNDPRLGFSFSGHAGLEATHSIADLLDYSLSLPQTRAVGLYLETVRDVDGLVQAFGSSNDLGIPVVALYSGRTQEARAQLMTHAGRMAGDLAALEALCRRYGVIRAKTLEEWWTTLALLAGERPLAAGGIAAVMDSGGGLAMFMDFAAELGVPIARISDGTRAKIQEIVGLDDEFGGALDFWVGSADRHAGTEQVLQTLVDDPDTAAIMAFTTFAEAGSAGFAMNIANACIRVSERTDKPVLATTYTSRQLHSDLMLELVEKGIPVLDGMWSGLQAVRHAMDHRTHMQMLQGRNNEESIPKAAPEALAFWKARLKQGAMLSEADALAALEVSGLATIQTLRADSQASVRSAGERLSFPLVLKTDEGIAHKALSGGVRVGLHDMDSLMSAYRDMAHRLGPKVVLAPLYSGIELAVGVVSGEYGPVVLVGSGGTLIESMPDRCALLAPVSRWQAEQAIDGLAVMSLIRARFGRNAGIDKQVIDYIWRLAALVGDLRDHLSELDVNPIIVGEDGPIAVDALAVAR